MADQALPSLALDVLSERMKKGNATSGWDAVVSYSCATLNDVLKALHAEKKLVSALSFTTETVDIVRETKMWIDYTLTLGEPLMRFLPDGSGTAIVAMPIRGAKYVMRDEKGEIRRGEIPDTYQLVMHAPLAAVQGGEKRSSGSLVEFSDHDPSKAHIHLHFKNQNGAGTLFEIAPTPPPEQHDIVVMYLLPRLRQYFQESVDEVQYALAVVHPTPTSPVAGGLTATPKSFVFSVSEDVLSIFIQVRESGRSAGNLRAVFAPGGVQTNPLPAGSNASIVLARDFVQRAYIAKSLAALGTCELDPTVTDGFRLSVYTRQGVARRNFSAESLYVHTKVDEVVLDYARAPYVVTLRGQTATVEWQFSQNLSWNRWVSAPRDPGASGTAHLSVRIPTITVPVATTDTSLRVSFTPPADRFEFMVTSDGKGGSWGAVETKLDGGVVENIKTFIKENPPPKLVFELGALDYFEIANVLFPDKTHFHVASEKSIGIVHDVLVVGTLKE